MPVGLLIVGSAILGVTGIGIGTKGGFDQYKAKTINDDADERLERATLRLEDMRVKCGNAITYLGEEKMKVLGGSVTRFVDAFTQIKNVELSNLEGLDKIGDIQIDNQDFEDIQKLCKFSISLIEGAGTGALSGAIAGFGAYGAAMKLASASTGIAISSLKGVAATNATLAWFGGGSLATGGMGMAGGTAVLGGVVAGPALLAMGIILGAKGGKNIENAKSNAYSANEICEQFENGSLECIAIRRRCYMLFNLLARLDAYLLPLTYQMEKIIDTEGTDYSQYSIESKKTIASAASTAVSVKTIINTSVLSSDGSLTEESKTVSNTLIDTIENSENDD